MKEAKYAKPNKSEGYGRLFAGNQGRNYEARQNEGKKTLDRVQLK